MIKQITNVPTNMVAFSAEGDVTADDYQQVVIPAVKKLVAETGKLNYLMVINTPISKFTIGAWWQDISFGLTEITNWERVAILSDSDTLNTFTNIFSKLVPGEFKGFKTEEMMEAVSWVSGAL